MKKSLGFPFGASTPIHPALIDFAKLLAASVVCGLAVALTAAVMTLLLVGTGDSDTPSLIQSAAQSSSAVSMP